MAKDHNAMDNKHNAIIMSKTYVTNFHKFLRHIYVVLISEHFSTQWVYSIALEYVNHMHLLYCHNNMHLNLVIDINKWWIYSYDFSQEELLRLMDFGAEWLFCA